MFGEEPYFLLGQYINSARVNSNLQYGLLSVTFSENREVGTIVLSMFATYPESNAFSISTQGLTKDDSVTE